MSLFALTYPTFNPVLIEIGPLAIRWYALAYIFGILFVWWYAARLVSNPKLWGPDGSPVTRKHLGDFVIWATVGIIAGGRLFYVFVYDFPQFRADPISVFQLWEGGMSFHGAFLGVVIALLLFAWRKRLPLWSLVDVVAAGVPLTLFFGRIANFINGELWGRVSDAPWAMAFPAATAENLAAGLPPDATRHPSQLYEAFLEGAVVFTILCILIYRFKALRRPGVVSAVFAIGYGTARIIGEFFREPDVQLGFISGGVTMGQILSVPMVIAGIILLVWTTRRHRATAAAE
ncbi:MAG: prolipoprotein diacylglyceryl transferase [Bauldia sp.]|nr:prolipoprotein diacylglyceryl transferase [Bauldia sp.]